MLAKVYEFGGLHSGAAVCSVLWFTLFSLILAWETWGVNTGLNGMLLLACTLTILVILWAMLRTSWPAYRFKKHDTFEYCHRLGKLALIFLIFIELYLFYLTLKDQAGTASPKLALLQHPASWLFIISAVHLLLPWLRLRPLDMNYI